MTDPDDRDPENADGPAVGLALRVPGPWASPEAFDRALPDGDDGGPFYAFVNVYGAAAGEALVVSLGDDDVAADDHPIHNLFGRYGLQRTPGVSLRAPVARGPA